MTTFGKKLSTFLKANGLTQREFAHQLDMSENTVSKIIGGRKPTFTFLEKLLERYPEIDLSKLIDQQEKNLSFINENRSSYSNSDPLRKEVETLMELANRLEILTRK